MSSTKSFVADAGIMDEGNVKASKATSDDRCFLLRLSGSAKDKEFFRHGHSLELDDDGDQAKAASGDDTATTTQASKLLGTSCATSVQACAEVRVGFGSQLSCWRRGSGLSYVTCEESFPIEGSAMLVKAVMRTVSSMWKGVDVRLRQVKRHDEATFAVVYEDLNESVYAVSFFHGLQEASWSYTSQPVQH